MHHDREPRTQQLFARALCTPGFLPADEADALYRAATRAIIEGFVPLVEIGAYRGRSTLVLAAALADRSDGNSTGNVLFSVDHHRGSEEMQAGWPDHDSELVDSSTGLMDSLPDWRAAVTSADVADLVIGIVGDSRLVAASWDAPVGFVFLDGGHGAVIAHADYEAWCAKLRGGGYLAIHDVFSDPSDGGRPPYECYRDAIDNKGYSEELDASVGSLRVLRKPGSANN